MFELLIWLTCLVPLAAALIAYLRTRDPLHPMVYLGLMMSYIYGILPAAYFYNDLISGIFRDESQLIFAQAVHLLSISACCAGCLWPRTKSKATCLSGRRTDMTPNLRASMERLSFALAAVGLIAYFYYLSLAGGFVEAYSRPKGGYVQGVSGYVTSLPFLTILATALLALSRQGTPLRFSTAAFMLLFMCPHIIQGTLGGSRGAAFLSAITFAFSWYMARSKPPSFGLIVSTLFAIGVLMLSLKAYRQTLYLGSEKDVEAVPFTQLILPTELNLSDATTYSWGLISVTHYHQKFYRGRRYFAQIIVRPVPRQLWPTKYEDIGMDWMVNRPGSGGFAYNEWDEAVGWAPQAGSSTGFVADTYAEFSWGGLIVSFLIGLLYGFLWKKAVILRTIWTVIYLEAAAVSVYLVTQGTTSAWMFRLLFLVIPTLLIWHFWIGPRLRTLPRPPMQRGVVTGV